MRRNRSQLFWFFAIIASLLLSACQASSAATPPAAVVPTGAPEQASATLPPPATPTSAPTDVPTKVPTPAPEAKVVWSFPAEGAIWGTPVIDQGVVYFGSDDDNLYAVDANTGEKLWSFKPNGLVRSLPAIAAGIIYVSGNDGFVYAVKQADGSKVWSAKISEPDVAPERTALGTSGSATGFDYLQSSPVVSEGQVFVGGFDGNVYALAAATGKVNWTFKTEDKIRATPAVDQGVVYIGSWDMNLYALDAKTGQLRWKTLMEGQIQTTALVADGVVYCASRKASVAAMDAKTGAVLWDHMYGVNMWVESSPRLVNGKLYVGSSGSQWVIVLDPKTGETASIFFQTAFFWSTPAVTGNRLYIGGISHMADQRGGMFALDLVDGKFASTTHELWHFPVETLEKYGEWGGVASSPVVVDGVIYFGGIDGNFYALSEG